MPPVEDHPVHEKVIQEEDFRYACWNKPRPVKGAPVSSTYSFPRSWPFVFSEECRFDMSLTDPNCEGCIWRGSGERYDEEIRSKGK